MNDIGPTSTDHGAAPTSGSGYRVLARKYRPKDFSDLMVGQEPMVRTLTNAFETGRIAQAYMLTGVRGVGKTTTARILARALNYEIPGRVSAPVPLLAALAGTGVVALWLVVSPAIPLTVGNIGGPVVCAAAAYGCHRIASRAGGSGAGRAGAGLGGAVAGAAAVVGAGRRDGEPAAGRPRRRRGVPAARPGREVVGGRCLRLSPQSY